MAGKPKYTPERVAAMIIKKNGFIGATAKQLGCSRCTVERYIKRYAACRKAIEVANEDRLDIFESQLIKNALAGKEASTIFFLKTKGQKRGYIQGDQSVGSADAISEAVQQINDVHKALREPDEG